MAIQINMYEAKTHLSKLAARAAHGETVIIARSGELYVQLTSVVLPDRMPGGYEGKIKMTSDFDDSDAKIASLFES